MAKIDSCKCRSAVVYIKALIFGLIIITSICSCQQEMTSDIKSKPSFLTLQLTANESSKTDPRTDVTLTRSVSGEDGNLKFKYDVDVPSVDDFYFVLALDSSGSLGDMGDPSQAEAVKYAVPEFINDTIAKYPNKTFNISIVSWDNDIDFIYPEQEKLIPILTVSRGLNEIFSESSNPRYVYQCEESDNTNLSQPLRASIDILDNNAPKDYRRNIKFILLIASAGEYAKCDPTLIAEARDKNYNTYIVGMGFKNVDKEQPEMYKHLEYICGEDYRITTCISEDEDLKGELFNHLKNALSTAISEPAADNVTLVESFYGHIYPDDSASVELLGVPGTLEYIKGETIDAGTIMFRLPVLSQDNITEITYGAKISLNGFPIFRTEYSNPVIFGLPIENAQLDPKPGFNYRWLMNDSFNFSIVLQPNNINILSVPTAAQPLTSGPLNPDNESNGQPLGSGFGFTTLIVLVATAVILMKKV